MPRIVIADSSTLILFDKINRLYILKNVYSQLITTHEVAKEFGAPLPEWMEIRAVSEIKYQEFLETQLDVGEASALALAKEFDDVLLILDDLKARKLAVRLNFKITGTLGVIHKAKEIGAIHKIKPLIDLLTNTDFRISKNIIDEILRFNGET